MLAYDCSMKYTSYVKYIKLCGFTIVFAVCCAGGDLGRGRCVLYSVPCWPGVLPRKAEKGKGLTRQCCCPQFSIVWFQFIYFQCVYMIGLSN